MAFSGCLGYDRRRRRGKKRRHPLERKELQTYQSAELGLRSRVVSLKISKIVCLVIVSRKIERTLVERKRWSPLELPHKLYLPVTCTDPFPILVPGVMRESLVDSHPNPTPPPRQGRREGGRRVRETPRPSGRGEEGKGAACRVGPMDTR